MDWGLGHVSRCVPIIHYLMNKGVEVILASSGNGQAFLKDKFPEVQHVFLEGYGVKYSSQNIQINIALQVPKILKRIKDEQQWLKNFVENNGIDAVISDNRYGLFSTTIPSVLITHQLNIQAPKLLENVLKKKVYNYLQNFTEIWVPDWEGKSSLAGNLSLNNSAFQTINYLGPLSHLPLENLPELKKKYDYLGIVSGPENQRSVFEDKLKQLFLSSEKKCLLVCGLPQEEFVEECDNVTRVSYLNSFRLGIAIQESETIICRAGYSTIMDLVALGKGAILVPTPGQTEQEYLAKHLDNKLGFCAMKQNNLETNGLSMRCFAPSGVALSVNNMTVVQSFLDHL